MSLKNFFLSTTLLSLANFARASAWMDPFFVDSPETAHYLGFDFEALVSPDKPTPDTRFGIENSVWGVEVNGQWVHWQDALKTAIDAAPLVSDCKNIDFILANFPIWRDETKKAAFDNTEPAYLKTISSLKALKLRPAVSKMDEMVTTREGLNRRARAVLFAMNAYHNKAWTAAREAAKEAVREASGAVFDDRLRYDAENAVSMAANGAAWAAGWEAPYYADWDAGWDFAQDAAYRAAKEAAYEASYGALDEIGKQTASGGAIDIEAIGRLAYLVAQKTSYTYFTQHAEIILTAVFNASLLEAAAPLKENIFASQNSWRAYKGRYFDILTPEQAHFRVSWLAELDEIVKRIEEFEG